MHHSERDYFLPSVHRRAIRGWLVRAFVCFALTSCTWLAGCSQERSQPLTSTETAPIQLQLNWIPDAQHGGFYAALVEYHFAAAGLSVQITPGGPGTPAISKLATGRCDFAIGNADQVLLARQQGADVVAVFAAMQNSPRCIMVHKSSGIESLDQIQNITLALGDGKAFAEYLKHKVPLENVRIVSYSGTVAKFLLDDQFAQQGYVFSEPLLAASKGGDPRALMVSDLGFNPYSSLLITRREVLESQPELVRKMVNAVQHGWESYLKNPQRANEQIVQANPEMDGEMLAKSAKEIAKLCRPPGFQDPLGSMSLERWDQLRAQLVELDLLPPDTGSAADAFAPEMLQ